MTHAYARGMLLEQKDYHTVDGPLAAAKTCRATYAQEARHDHAER